jgi:hypothetical protein
LTQFRQGKKEEKIWFKTATKMTDMHYRRDTLVSKSTDSDEYAIVYCDNLASDKVKKVEVVLFDKDD